MHTCVFLFYQQSKSFKSAMQCQYLRLFVYHSSTFLAGCLSMFFAVEELNPIEAQTSSKFCFRQITHNKSKLQLFDSEKTGFS